MSVTVVIPSRGRPDRARVAVEALRDNAALVSTNVILAVDADDPELGGYRSLRFRPFGAEVVTVTLGPEDTGDLVRATNTVSMRVADVEPTGIIGNLGDDHVCRTPGWDRLVTAALETPGIAYGDDRIQGEHLPTAPFISAAIVNALGWYALPCCRHMYIDDAWKALGKYLGILRYIPELVIEHVHPASGQAEWDDGYARAHALMEPDHVAYDRWRNTSFYADVTNIRRLLGNGVR